MVTTRRIFLAHVLVACALAFWSFLSPAIALATEQAWADVDLATFGSYHTEAFKHPDFEGDADAIRVEYAGAWKGGVIEALGMGSVRLSDFWEQDGRQYAIGRIGWPDGVDAAIALVRP